MIEALYNMDRIRLVLVRFTQDAKLYLNVNPENVQWVDINNFAIYNIRSNTNWNVK